VLSDTVAIYYRRHRGNATNDTALMRRHLLRAALRSAQRRRNDPALDNIPDVFDLANFAAFLERQNAAAEKPRARTGA
jgi:hypothetical protein